MTKFNNNHTKQSWLSCVSWWTAVSKESSGWVFGNVIVHRCPDLSADDITSAWWECVHQGESVVCRGSLQRWDFCFSYSNTTLYDSSACNMWRAGADLTHTGWLRLSIALSASAASAAAFFSSNSSLFRTGPFRPSSTRLRANSLLCKTENRREFC